MNAFGIFFVVFIITGSFFMLELFVGAIVTSYTLLNEESGGTAFQSDRQQAAVAKLVLRDDSQVFKATFAYQGNETEGLYGLVHAAWVDNLVMGCIIMNIVLMAISFHDMSDGYSQHLDLINVVFTFIFAGEAVLKIFAELPARYFKGGWNQYDFFVAVVTVGEFAYTKMAGPDASEIPGVAIIRVFRILRVFRLLRKFRGLCDLFLTVIHALPTIMNVGAVLLLIYFIYAVLGMHLFGRIKRGEFLNAHANFETFGRSLLTVFRMSTGEVKFEERACFAHEFLIALLFTVLCSLTMLDRMYCAELECHYARLSGFISGLRPAGKPSVRELCDLALHLRWHHGCAGGLWL